VLLVAITSAPTTFNMQASYVQNGSAAYLGRLPAVMNCSFNVIPHKLVSQFSLNSLVV